MPKARRKQSKKENSAGAGNIPVNEGREWWKYTASPSPYYSPQFVVASPKKKRNELKYSIPGVLSPIVQNGEDCENSQQNLICADHPDDIQLDVYFRTLITSLGIPIDDISRMQLSTDEKWNLIHSYNRIAVPQADIITNEESECIQSSATIKKNQAIIKQLSNKKKSQKSGTVLQQMSSLQYIQCIGILLNQHKSIIQTREPAKRKKSNTAPHNLSNSDSDALMLLLQGLRVSLSSKPVQWLTEFIHHEGMKYVISTLSLFHSSSFPSLLFPQIQFEALKCLNLCLNHYLGLEKLVEDDVQCLSCIQQIVFGLSASLNSSKAVSAKLLAVFASLDDHRTTVLNSLTQAAKLGNEPSRFFRLVLCLNDESSLEVKVNCLVLINALVFDSIKSQRIPLVSEFDQLGIESSLSMLERCFPLKDDQMMFRILHTQIEQFREFLDTSGSSEEEDEEDGEDLEFDFDSQSSYLAAEYYKKRLQKESSKTKELVSQLEELQASYYSIYEETQSLRVIKEESGYELSTLRSELSDIQKYLKKSKKTLPSEQSKRLTNVEQSFTDLFLQFGKEFDSARDLQIDVPVDSLKVKYSQLETVNDFLQEKQTSMDKELRQTQQERRIAEEKCEQFSQENEELNNVLTTIRSSHEEYKSRNESLMKEMNQEKSELQQETILLRSRVNSLEESQRILSVSLDASSGMEQRQEETIKQLQTQISVTNELAESLTDQIRQLELQQDSHLNSINASLQELDTCRCIIRENNTTIDLQEILITELRINAKSAESRYSDDLDSLMEQLHEEKQITKVLTKEKKELEASNVEMNEKLQKLSDDANLLNDSLDDTKQELSNIHKQLERVLKEEKEPLEAEYELLQSQHAIAQSNLTKVSNQLESLQSELYQIEQDNQYLKSKNEATNKSLEEISIENQDLHSQCDSLTAQLRHLKQENIVLQTKLESTQAQVTSNEEERNKLESITAQCELKLEQLETQSIMNTKERTELQEQKESLQKNLGIVQNQMKNLSAHQLKLQEERKDFDELQEKFIGEKRRIEEQLELKAAELNSLRETHNNQILNFQNAKHQFNQEISHFLHSKQVHNERIEEKMKFIDEQVQNIELTLSNLAQEKEAFQCFQLAEQKNIQEQKAAQIQRTEEQSAIQQTESPQIVESNVSVSTGPLPSAPPPPPPPALMAPIKLPPAEGSDLVPSVKMKALNWKKIAPVSWKDSMWATVESPDVIVPTEKLEELFTAKPVNTEVCTQPSTKKKPIAKSVTLLDPRRAQNVAILLSSCKSSTQSIHSAIQSIDSRALNDSLLSQLQKHSPQPEEIELIQSALQESPQLQLGPAETFFMQLASIPYYNERIQLMMATKSFEGKYQDLVNQMNMLMNALTSIESAKHFPVLLKIILHFGNFFNHGSSRGSANGFKLSSLDSLSQMRTATSSPSHKTFLHVFSCYLEEKFPEVENGFQAELANTVSVAGQSLDGVGASIRSLSQEIHRCEQTMQELQSDDELDQQRIDFIASFLHDATEKIAFLSEYDNETHIKLESLAKFYGFSSREISQMKFEEFLGYFGHFCQSYRQIKKEILLINKRQDASARRDAAAKERKETLARKKEEKLQQKQQREEKMVDNLFEDLCGGNFKRNPRRRRTSRIPIPSKQITSDYMKEEILDIWNTCVQKKRKRTKTPIHLTPIA